MRVPSKRRQLRHGPNAACALGPSCRHAGRGYGPDMRAVPGEWTQTAIAVCPFEPDACRRIVVFVVSSLSLPTKSRSPRCGRIRPQFAFPLPPPLLPGSLVLLDFLSPKAGAASRHLSARRAHLGLRWRPCCWFRSRGEGPEGAEQVGDLGRLRFLLRGCGSKAWCFPLHLLTPESNRSPLIWFVASVHELAPRDLPFGSASGVL
jgi:hypothetical protein